MSAKRQKIEEYLRRVESYLYQQHSVEVEYSQECKNSYYHDISKIEINSRQNYNSRLNSLLHEAGRAIIRSNGSFMREDFNQIDVLREEVLAWEEASTLADHLLIELDKKLFARHRSAALKTYIEWI